MALKDTLKNLVRFKRAATAEALEPESSPAVLAVPTASDPVLMREDGVTADAEDTAIVYVRDGNGLSKCRVRYGRQFSFTINGRQCAHVDDAPDGTWVYEYRSY